MGGGDASGRGGRTVAHMAVGARTTTRREPDGVRRCRWRRLCSREEKKKRKKEKWWVVDSSENEASGFLCSLRTFESEHYRLYRKENKPVVKMEDTSCCNKRQANAEGRVSVFLQLFALAPNSFVEFTSDEATEMRIQISFQMSYVVSDPNVICWIPFSEFHTLFFC
jgi:hypothetical protein